MTENPSFYAIIPANVRYSDITPNAKLLYGEITALCNKTGYCFATNEYFSNLYGVSKVSISKWIKELIDNGFVLSEIEYKEGTKQILIRYLRIVNDPIKEIFNTPIKEKFKDNNTSINNTYNIYEKEFKAFWSLYPKQRAGSKQKAYNSFVKVLKENRCTADGLIESVKCYAASDEVKKGYAKGCAAWLDDDRFNNQYNSVVVEKRIDPEVSVEDVY